MAGLSRTWVAPLSVFAASLVFAIVLGLTLACQPSETDRFEERWVELGVPEAEFVFLGDLTSDERESIRRELRVAQVVLAEHFGAVTSDFTVYVSTDLDLLNQRIAVDRPDIPPAWLTCGGFAPRGALLLVLQDCGEELRARGGPMAHEYFHILQWHAGRLERTPQRFWLVEGSAVYASSLVSEAQGRRSLATRRKSARLVWSSLGQRFPFRGDLSEAEYDAHLYLVGFLAAEWLVEQAGQEAILSFYRLGSHDTAFHRAFGIRLEGFYSAFEKHRLEVAPPFEWRVEGTVLGANGAPVGRLDVFAMVRIEGERWTAGIGETDAQGNFEFPAPGSGYTLGVFLQCPRSDIFQWVHAGEWGAAGLVADSDGIWEPGQEGAEPFTDGERDRTGMVIELPETRDSLVAKHCEP